jgi:hypothetical protein
VHGSHRVVPAVSHVQRPAIQRQPLRFGEARLQRRPVGIAVLAAPERARHLGLGRSGHPQLEHAVVPAVGDVQRPVVLDGPFAETREQLGGYYLIDAADLDEAITIAERIPVARMGTVEIRPLLEIPGLPD